jgi:hypothetical protein
MLMPEQLYKKINSKINKLISENNPSLKESLVEI